METYKTEYNKLLTRFNNGCKYIIENPDKENKYLPELSKIAEKMEEMIADYKIPKEIRVGGFKE